MLIMTFPLNIYHGDLDSLVYRIPGIPILRHTLVFVSCVGDGAVGVLAYRLHMALLGSASFTCRFDPCGFASAKVNSSEDLSVVGYVLAKPLQEFLEEQLSSSRFFVQVLAPAWPFWPKLEN